MSMTQERLVSKRRTDDELAQAEWINPSEIMRMYPGFSYMAIMRLVKHNQWRITRTGLNSRIIWISRDEFDAWLNEYGGPYAPRSGLSVSLEPVKDGVRWRLNDQGKPALHPNARPETRPPLFYVPGARTGLGGRPPVHVLRTDVPMRARTTGRIVDGSHHASWELTHAVARTLIDAGLPSPGGPELEDLQRLLTAYIKHVRKASAPGRRRSPRTKSGQ